MILSVKKQVYEGGKMKLTIAVVLMLMVGVAGLDSKAGPVSKEQGKDIPTCFPGDPCGPGKASPNVMQAG